MPGTYDVARAFEAQPSTCPGSSTASTRPGDGACSGRSRHRSGSSPGSHGSAATENRRSRPRLTDGPGPPATTHLAAGAVATTFRGCPRPAFLVVRLITEQSEVHMSPPPPFSRGSARLVHRHRPLTSVFALGSRSEIEFLGRFFSGVDQLLPTLPMQGGHGGEGRHAGGSRQTVGLDGGLRMRAQGMRRRGLLSANAAMFAM